VGVRFELGTTVWDPPPPPHPEPLSDSNRSPGLDLNQRNPSRGQTLTVHWWLLASSPALTVLHITFQHHVLRCFVCDFFMGIMRPCIIFVVPLVGIHIKLRSIIKEHISRPVIISIIMNRDNRQ